MPRFPPGQVTELLRRMMNFWGTVSECGAPQNGDMVVLSEG